MNCLLINDLYSDFAAVLESLRSCNHAPFL